MNTGRTAHDASPEIDQAQEAVTEPMPAQPAEPVPTDAGDPVAAPCPSCSGGLHADQRYCLNCGEPVAGLAPTLESSFRTSSSAAVIPAPRLRRSSTLGPLAALGGATLTGALLTALLIAALGGNTPAPIAVNVPAAKAPVVNVAAPSAGGATTEAPFVSDWPGGNRWTVQLQAMPKSGTTPSAVAAAKAAATSAGAADVGALDSDEHPSLDTGNYLVYSGVFRTKAQATAAAARLASRFAGAKAVRVASAPPPKATKATKEKLEDLRDSSGDEYTEKSKKLPDSVVTPGPTAPKKDAPTAPADEGDTDVIG